jgi:atlastin
VYIFQDIDEEYLQFKAHNESKNIFKSARTPAVFFAIAVACYFISGTLNFFGVNSVASGINLIMGITLLILVLWAYIRQVIYNNISMLHQYLF